jgi:hypothetical protein
MSQLNQELLERLRTDDALALAIAKGTNRKFGTVQKWISGDDRLNMLTSKAVVLIIKEETGLKEDEIIEQERVA